MHTLTLRRASVGRAVRAAAHPAVLAAIGLLLVNDHWLRWAHPSWLTGKLGDAAWLFFMPFIIAPLLAWLLPTSLPRRDAWVGLAAGLLVGGIFAAVKTLPVAHAAFRAGFAAVLGWESILLRDPTDLLTLPALWPAWRLWQSTARQRPAAAPYRTAGVIALAAFATIANSGPKDPGITCLHLEEARIYAIADWAGMTGGVYTSDDGGLTWDTLVSDYPTMEQQASLPDYQCRHLASHTWLLAGTAPGEFYRFVPGDRIERSTDEGRTWTVEQYLSKRYVRPANEHYSGSYTSAETRSGPEDALYDPATGNLIVAMEWKGTLVREPDGTWHWITVGPYAAQIVREQ